MKVYAAQEQKPPINMRGLYFAYGLWQTGMYIGHTWCEDGDRGADAADGDWSHWCELPANPEEISMRVRAA